MTERRSSKRLPVNIDARFFRDNMFYSGKILNLSNGGMLIKTNIDIPNGESFIVLLSAKKDIPKLVARVKRIKDNKTTAPDIGVELIDPPSEYTDFVEDLSYYLYI